MKKIIGISLLTCLLAPLLGTYFYLQYQRATVRKEVKKQLLSAIDQEDLVALKFSIEDSRQLEWEHAREFAYKGQMYDVVSSEIMGDSILYHCWWDAAESKIKQQLDQLVAQAFDQHPQNRQQQERLFDFYKNLFYPHRPSLQNKPNEHCLVKPFVANKAYLSFQFSPAVPPPEAT